MAASGGSTKVVAGQSVRAIDPATAFITAHGLDKARPDYKVLINWGGFEQSAQHLVI